MRLRRRAGVVLRHVAGEHMLVPTMTRIVDLESLFLLNATGVAVWEHLNGGERIGDACQYIADTFAIDPQAAQADVTAFLADLLQSNLVEIVAAHGS
ncbi:MAG: PqqD family protein [Kiritimatiellae bacterium]|nr:PqqD family protein [Kiritimatiellia bacterium]